MTEEEFLRVSQKYLAGKATAAEQEALKRYRDDIQLADDEWEPGMGDKTALYRDLSEAVFLHVGQAGRTANVWSGLLKIAAILLVVLSAATLFWLYRPHHGERLSKRTPAERILPADDQAYLTLADGSRIALNKHQGDLKLKNGQSVHNEKDGVLVYNFSKPVPADDLAPELFNTITTPYAGRYSVILADGTRVWLNAGSSLRFPVAFNGKERVVELSGEAYFEVAKNKHKPFIVKTSHSEIAVLGTHFNVSAYPDDEYTATTLLEGSVKLSQAGSSVQLLPGQVGTVLNRLNSISVRKADIEMALSWKNGLFIFDNQSMAEVMKKVARWYNVEVEFKGNSSAKEFGGSISRFKDISELLELMKLAGGIHYKIEGRRVTIMD